MYVTISAAKRLCTSHGQRSNHTLSQRYMPGSHETYLFHISWHFDPLVLLNAWQCPACTECWFAQASAPTATTKRESKYDGIRKCFAQRLKYSRYIQHVSEGPQVSLNFDLTACSRVQSPVAISDIAIYRSIHCFEFSRSKTKTLHTRAPGFRRA